MELDWIRRLFRVEQTRNEPRRINLGELAVEISSPEEVDCRRLEPYVAWSRAVRHKADVQITWRNDSDLLSEARELLRAESAPASIDAMYAAYNLSLNKRSSAERHPTRYMRRGVWTIADFSYWKDDFVLLYDERCLHVGLIGSRSALERVLVDLLTVQLEHCPAHGLVMERNGKQTVYVGDSGAGKSYTLLAQRATHRVVSNDMACIFEGVALPIVEDISFCSGDVPDGLPLVKRGHGKKVVDFEVLVARLGLRVSAGGSVHAVKVLERTARKGRAFSVRDMAQPFPMVTRQSFWALPLLRVGDEREYLTHYFQRSIEFWSEMIGDA